MIYNLKGGGSLTQRSITEQPLSSVLKYQLSASNSYVLGKPVIIKFTLYNLLDENIWVLTWYTPLEGLKGKIFLVTCNGKEIPYEGRMVKRGNPTQDDYIYIASKGLASTRGRFVKRLQLSNI